MPTENRSAAHYAELAAAFELTAACRAHQNTMRHCPVGPYPCPFGRTPCDAIVVDDWFARLQVDTRRENFCGC